MIISFSFFFFFYISFASSSSFNATHKCSPQQSLDLLLFKENMSFINNSGDYVMDSDCKGWLGSGYHPITMNWNKNTDCCKWNGITCNHLTGDVIGIDLSCGMLQGTIHPNTTLFHLPHLQTLNLAFNNFFHSQLPREIGGLSKSLTLLNLSDCGFTGDTPEEILYLPKLVSLDLSWNDGLQIQPSVLKNLLLNSTHLKELLLKEVDISWVLPRYLNISTSLKSLDLRSTNLQGKFPDNIFSLQYLEKLLLSFNYDLTGPLPTVNTTTNIPLKWLGLSGTNLPGEIPESVGHLKSLTTLGLSNCGLVGSIPKSLVNLTQLTTLYLSSNKLNGTLPSFVFTLPFIEILNLANNNFTGLWDLNTLFSSLSNLQTLDLSYSGLIVVSNNNTKYVNPDFRDLRLASCNLTVFPESLRAMKKLKYLDLSSNHIHGHIPDWAPEIGGNGLRILILSYNFITSLPARFQWDGLEGLHVQTNQIQGPFPQSICGLSSLLRLDISNNSFDGVIPQCLGNISSSLTRLAVKLNKLQGPFPSLLCNMSLLITLDMSGNNFRGEIPQCFGNISSSLRMVDMGNNDFHGTIPNMYECGQLQGLIMKGNQLQGEIPSSLSKCRSFLILDLGNNQLNGTFPHWLGDLPYLQVLVLKSNKLHGPIQTPSTTQNAFPSIRVLILSHNKFVGLLPRTYLQNVSVMKNKTRKSTIPSYLNMGGKYYSVTTAVKGAVLEFPKISVNYLILDLSNNKFEGEIPNVIGSLTSLIVLDLSHNNLTGQIPSVLGNLSEIESLDLSWNQLTGEIPQALAGLKFLGFLNLSQNHLKGRIPSGGQFNTFGTSFEGNPKLCGLPLPKLCGLPHEPQHELDGDGDGDWESGFTWKMVMLGYGCGTLPGLLIGYFMLSTGRPKWLNALVPEAEHIIHTMKTTRRRRYIFIGK